MKTTQHPAIVPLATLRTTCPALLLALACATSLSAASLYWAPDNDANGGNGTWDTASSLWSAAADGSGTLQTWNNVATPYNDAFFARGKTGTVAVSGEVNVGWLDFGGTTADASTSYTLNGGTIILGGHSAGWESTRTIQSTGNVTINSTIRMFEDVAAAGHRRFGNQGGTLTINDIANASTGGTQNLSLESWGTGTIKIDGNITNTFGAPRTSLIIGGSDLNTVAGSGSNYHLGGNNTGVSNTSLLRGTLHLNHSNALGSGGLTVRNVTNSDTINILIGTAGVTIGNAITFDSFTNTSWTRTIGGEHTSGTATFSGTITLGAFAASGNGDRLNVTSAAGGTTIFSGNITDGANTSRVVKTGAGIVKFNRTDGMDYDGATIVTAGTLIVNNTTGSGTGRGAVAVRNGATLGGAARVAGNITLDAGARFSTGDMDESGVSSAGTLATAGSFTWNSNNTAASLFFDLGADQASSDQLNIAGAFTKGNGTSFIFDFTGSALPASFTYTLVTFNSTNFTDAGIFSANIDGTFAINDNSLTFTTAAIPEPAAFVLLSALGIGFLAAALRFRKTQV
ncbi:hypothetical protein OPIT5_10405 [Opitutaceae bacterium TAV5]|nr:hypothetical protein OPIT5_10405 [Opitutaceae bacterium TAV5]